LRSPAPSLLDDLARIVGRERVLARPIDLLARSVDASIYRMIPQAVVRPRDLDEVRALLAYAHTHDRHLTFRTAGTSLSGQAVTDDLLVELAPFWKAFRILDEGARVWTQPGVVGGHLNLRLAPFGRRLGPDPASIDACMMGGIVANNSSGMCCGVAQNTYHTLEAITVMLADGTLVDTAEPDVDARLLAARPDLHAALLRLRDEIRGDPALVALLRRKFSLKNTTGYSLHAFLDHDTPAQILAHLMVGSQGTLGFWANATLRTVPEPKWRATALVYFDELTDAGAAVAPLAAAGAAALEIMDAISLRSQAGDRAYPFTIEDRTAALLVEMRADSEPLLDTCVAEAEAVLAKFALKAPVAFTRVPSERDAHWRLRKGLFPSVGGVRRSGTAVVIEDVAVPADRLAEAILDLKALFKAHDFEDAILFGHAKDGNLHFVFARDFADPVTVRHYADFMQAVSDLVIDKYAGSLKAEHGSGRNMAPFVRQEFGEQAYALLKEVKRLFDPAGVLNPDVVLSDDPDIHLKNLKPLPSISPTADKCIECGFCEARCPSRDLTLTPRQRIVAVREMTRLLTVPGAEAQAWRVSLLADFAYEGDATCARDGMCQTSCPVKIDTGALMKELQKAAHTPAAHRTAASLARRFGTVARAARTALRAAALARRLPGGARLVQGNTAVLHRLWPSLVPRIDPELELPRPAPPLPALSDGAGPGVVYFPSCLSRILGPLPGEDSVSTPVAVRDALAAAGFAARYPEGLTGLCCGMPFASKAFPDAARLAASRTAEALWAASRDGTHVVVTDASPCAGTLRDLAVTHLAASGRALTVLDFPTFWAREGLSRGKPARVSGTAVLHPTCTLVKMGGLPDLLAVARAYSEEVVVPPSAECCGFAGDRGFLVPELTRSATLRESGDVKAVLSADPDARLFSTCRTCEIGLSRGVGRPYRSIAHLVREALLGG
jgi:D-lactate dehydrogenase